MEHFLLRRESLEIIRKPKLDDILKIYEGLDQDKLFNFLHILDPTVIFPGANVPELKILERHTRRLCNAIHIERFRKLPQTVTKRKRNIEKRKARCKPAGTVNRGYYCFKTRST